MHVWLAEASPQRQTVLVTRYEPSQPDPSVSTLVLAFTTAEGRCTLRLTEADEYDWASLRRLSMPYAPLLGLLGLLSIGSGMYDGLFLHEKTLSWSAFPPRSV
ncbi:hypothetical protein ACI68E_004407 [Malassezia pachydermatis]